MSKDKKGFLGLGGLFRTIKNKIMGDFLTKLIAGLYEKFKASNPKIAMAVLALATGLQFGFEAPLETFLVTIGVVVDLPAEFLSLDWILDATGLKISDGLTDGIMWVLMALSGSKSTEFLPEEKRAEKLADQSARIKRRELKRALKEAARDAGKNGGTAL